MPYFNNCTNGIWASRGSSVVQSATNPKKFVFNNIKNVALQFQDNSVGLFNGGTGVTGATGSLSNTNIDLFYSPVGINIKSSTVKIRSTNLDTVRYGIIGVDNSYVEFSDSYVNGMYGVANGATPTRAIYLDTNSCGVAFGISSAGFSGNTGPGATSAFYTSVNNSLLILSGTFDSLRVQTTTTNSSVAGYVSLNPLRLIGVDALGTVGGAEIPGGHP